MSQVLQKALACESHAKEARSFQRSNDRNMSNCPTVNVVAYDSEALDDENIDVCVAEWTWPPSSSHSFALL